MLINVLIDIANSMFKFFDFSANASVEARLRCSTLRVRVFVCFIEVDEKAGCRGFCLLYR